MFTPYSASGVKIGPWTVETMNRIMSWETKIMIRLFRFARKKDETVVAYNTRCCRTARKYGYRWAYPF